MSRSSNSAESSSLAGEEAKICRKERSRITKELSFRRRLWSFNPYIYLNQCRKPLIFQTMNSVRSNILSLKYQTFQPSDLKDLGIWNSLCQNLIFFSQILCPGLGTFVLKIKQNTLIVWSRYPLRALLIWGSMLNLFVLVIPLHLIKATFNPWLGLIKD